MITRHMLGIIAGLGVFLSAFVVAPVTAADDFAGAKEAKVVWDVTTGDEKVFQDRMDLIKQTAESLRQRGIKPEFVIAIRGHATKFVTKTLTGTKFEKDKLEKLPSIQSQLGELQQAGTKIEVCNIAAGRTGVAQDNMMSFAVIEKNVFENLIMLQNKGYAYMPVF